MKLLRTLILTLSIVFVFLWTSSPTLSSFNLQLTGALILLYFASRLIFRSVRRSFFFATIILISIVLLLMFSTGGITSPIFFILLFLLFAISLLIAPGQAAVASILLIIIFLWQNYQNLTSPMIIDLISLALMTPIAITFSKTYLKSLETAGKISLLQEAIKDEQSDSLLWISTTAKPSLSSVLNSLTDIVIYLNGKGQALIAPKSLLEKLKTIQKDLISLYASTGNLEKSIEDTSDKMEL